MVSQISCYIYIILNNCNERPYGAFHHYSIVVLMILLYLLEKLDFGEMKVYNFILVVGFCMYKMSIPFQCDGKKSQFDYDFLVV